MIQVLDTSKISYNKLKLRTNLLKKNLKISRLFSIFIKQDRYDEKINKINGRQHIYKSIKRTIEFFKNTLSDINTICCARSHDFLCTNVQLFNQTRNSDKFMDGHQNANLNCNLVILHKRQGSLVVRRDELTSITYNIDPIEKIMLYNQNVKHNNVLYTLYLDIWVDGHTQECSVLKIHKTNKQNTNANDNETSENKKDSVVGGNKTKKKDGVEKTSVFIQNDKHSNKNTSKSDT